jgi:hypothetical protein
METMETMETMKTHCVFSLNIQNIKCVIFLAVTYMDERSAWGVLDIPAKG